MALLFDPMNSLLRLQKDIDRYFGKPAFDFGVSGPNVFPQLNVFATKDGTVIVRAEVPGIRAEDVHVEVEARRLTISGERKSDAPADGSVHRRERGHGKFSRTIQLPPDLATDEAKATVRNGLLTLTIPKRQEARPRQITVSAS